MLRWTIRAIGRLIAVLFLATLPIYILPLTNGLIEGVLFADMTSRQDADTLGLVQHDIETARMMDKASVPGVPGIHDTDRPPFHIVQLRDPTNWWKKLGLVRFDVPHRGLSLEASGAEGVRDGAARLDTLYRPTRSYENGAPWHGWVYASGQVSHAEGQFLDAWDAAFDELLRCYYVQPPPYNAAFHYISCPVRSFCDLWFVKGPALLHFTTERSEEEEAYLPRPQIPGFDSVTVRVIEFPIKDPGELPLPPGVFPTPFNQLRSVTADRSAWQMYDPYSPLTQSLRRLIDMCKIMEKTHARTYGRLFQLEEYVFHKIGLDGDDVWYGIPRLVGIVVASLAKSKVVDPLWRVIKGCVERVFGAGPEGTPDCHEASTTEDNTPTINDLFADLVRRQIDEMPEDARALLMSSGEKNEAARSILDVYNKSNGEPFADKARGHAEW